MGNEHSTGSFDVSDKPGTPPLTMENVFEEQPLQMSPDTGTEVNELPGDERSASQIVPQQEDSNSFSPPAEETEAQESFQEGGKLLSLTQSSSLDKGQPFGEANELDIGKPPVEHSSEKAEYTMPLKPAGELDAGTRAVLLLGEGQSMDAELQKTAEDIHCLAGSAVPRTPSEISTRSPTEKEEDTEKQRMLNDSSSEMVAEVHPEGHSQMKTALLVTKPLEPQSSAEEEHKGAEFAPLPVREARTGPDKGCPAATEVAEDQIASGIPKEADGESTLAQDAVDSFDVKPLGSNEDEHAATEFINAIQNDGAYLATEAMSSVKEHPASGTIQDTEAEPLKDHLAESSSKVMEGLDKAKESSLMKETGEACSNPVARAMAEAQVPSLGEHPPIALISCAEARCEPVAQETEALLTAEVATQIQGLSGAQKDSPKGPMHPRKQEAKFLRTCFCCSQCNVGEVNADPEED